MKYTLAICLLLICQLGYANNPDLVKITEEIKAPAKSTVLNEEVEDAIYHLRHNVKEEDRLYIRFFSTYSIPKEHRQAAVLTCSFVLHSLIGPADDEEDNIGGYYPLAKIEMEGDKKIFRTYRKVPDSETLWWIDLREYNLGLQAWETASAVEPYFVAPVVNNSINDYLRILSGNAVIRMDWFIYHATDITAESDADRKTRIYNTLVYSQVKEPKTVQEFHKTWGIEDVDKQRLQGNEYGTLVTKSRNVARHNRFLFGYRTPTGWLYQTFDVKHQEGKRDYVESLPLFKGKPPTIFDGGEMFATNALKMQIYSLFNAEQKIVDDADPKLARHMTDVLGDARVRTAFSCMDCHAAGPIPPENTIAEYIKKMGISKIPYKVDQLRIKRTFLEEKFEDATQQDQLAFAKSLLKINGLSPQDNAKNYLRLVQDYNEPLTVDDVAFECGVTKEFLLEKCKDGLQEYNYKIPGRLAILLTTNEGIPRDIWDSPGADGYPGTFQQTMLILYGLTLIEKTTIERDLVVYITNEECPVQSGATVLAKIKKGTEIPEQYIQNKNIDALGNSWVYIKYGNIDGWVQEKFLVKR